jgi:hypothetical protein
LPETLLVLIAIPFGSVFVFLLFYGMNKLITYAPKDKKESLEARMFVGPSIFMIFLFLFYPAIRTFYLSFKGRFSDELCRIEKLQMGFY